jgi:xylan 1,4-beta-xylosidase
MLKYNGSYYLIYSVPCLSNSYANGVYVSDSPTGPFTYQDYSPFSQKLTGFIGGAGHGQVFQDKHGNWWNVTCESLWALHRFERRVGLYPAGFDTDGQINTDTLFADYPISVEPCLLSNQLASRSAGWMLLSRGKPAVASSSLADHSPKLVCDENVKTWWSAETGNAGEWLQLDLESSCTVHAVQVNFAEQHLSDTNERDLYIQYRIECSKDGIVWEMLTDKYENTLDIPHDYLEFPHVIVTRYIKITNKHMPFGGAFALRGLRVFGNAGGSLPPQTNFTVIRDPNDHRNALVNWDSVEGADGYVIRYGIAPDKLFRSYEVYDTNWQVRSLNKGVDYYFTVDTFNRNGHTRGTLITGAS